MNSSVKCTFLVAASVPSTSVTSLPQPQGLMGNSAAFATNPIAGITTSNISTISPFYYDKMTTDPDNPLHSDLEYTFKLLYKIASCKTEAECQEEYGKAGLLVYNNTICTLLSMAIRAEEAYTETIINAFKLNQDLRNLIYKLNGNNTSEYKSIELECNKVYK